MIKNNANLIGSYKLYINIAIVLNVDLIATAHDSHNLIGIKTSRATNYPETRNAFIRSRIKKAYLLRCWGFKLTQFRQWAPQS